MNEHPMPSAPQGPVKQSTTPAWLAYLFGWISGLIVFLTAKDSFTKFHGAQSVILFGGLHVLFLIIGTMTNYTFYWRAGALWSLFQLAVIVLWVLLMYKAYKGERWKLPLVGDWAEKWAK